MVAGTGAGTGRYRDRFPHRDRYRDRCRYRPLTLTCTDLQLFACLGTKLKLFTPAIRTPVRNYSYSHTCTELQLFAHVCTTTLNTSQGSHITPPRIKEQLVGGLELSQLEAALIH